MSRVAVVGGGLAGTLAALRLLEAGHEVQLREAEPGLGGMIAPRELAGVLVDAGAEAYAVRGGVGRAGLVALAALFLTVIANAMNLLQFDSKYQALVLGVVLILALGIERLLLRRSET